MASKREINAWILGLTTFLSACSHSVSGSYLAGGTNFSELLQVTQSDGGQLLGVLEHAELKPDGTVVRRTINISGVSDGYSITLVGKTNEQFSSPFNISGTFEGNVISLNLRVGTERFVRSDPEAYQARLQAFATQADTIRVQQADRERERNVARQTASRQVEAQRRLEQANQRASALTDSLRRYVALIKARKGLSVQFEAWHAKAIAAAQRDLELQRAAPRGSVQSSQLDVRINQLEVQLRGFDMPYQQTIERHRDSLKQFDEAIVKSPCHSNDVALSACQDLRGAEIAYQAARLILEQELNDIETLSKRDARSMSQYVKEADAMDTPRR